MTEGILGQGMKERLREIESSLWKTLLEKKPFTLDDIAALIKDPQYMAAVGISKQHSDNIVAFRRPFDSYSGDNYSGCEPNKEFSDEELLSLARGRQSTRSMENYFNPLVLDLRVLRGQLPDSQQNIGPERVEAVIRLARVDRLLKSIPAIQQMQRAQDEIDNPALKTWVARNVFSALDPYTQQTVREVFELARSQQRSSYNIVNHGLSHTFPQGEEAQVLEQRNRSVQAYTSESVLLNSLLGLSSATRPASRAKQFAETVALLGEDPAGTIKSGIKHVTESALASCAHRLGLARFLSSSHDHTQ